MVKLLEEINKLNKNLDEEFEKKLKRIEVCLEKGVECPCDIEDCGIDYEKIDKLDKLYVKLLKEHKVIKNIG